MPEYKYICKKCGKEITVELKISEAPLKVCPSCDCKDCLDRIFEAVPYIDHTNSFYSSNNIK